MNIELTREEFNLHVTALDTLARAIASKIVNSQSAGLELKNNLSLFSDINKQFDKLQEYLDKGEEQ